MSTVVFYSAIDRAWFIWDNATDKVVARTLTEESAKAAHRLLTGGKRSFKDDLLELSVA